MRAILLNEVRQRLLTHDRIEDLPDDPIGLFQGGFRHVEQKGCLAMHLLEVTQQLIDYLFLCPHRDAMNDLNEEVHQTINNLLSPLPTKGCQ